MSYNPPPEKRAVTQQEAVEISYKHGTIDTVETAREIAEQWGNRYPDWQFNYYCMLAAVYSAGYIKGKQDERAKRRKERANAGTSKNTTVRV